MTREQLRKFCLALPHATEQVQWGNDLVFKIGGKMFAVSCLDPSEIFVSFKCAPETFAELVERPGIKPAPYLARAQWAAVESERTLPVKELERLLREAHQLIAAKLPKNVRVQLGL